MPIRDFFVNAKSRVMNEIGIVLIIALSILGFGAVSGRLIKSPITAPMVFTSIGFLIGPGGFGLAEINVGAESTMLLAELTLVLILFTDASRINIATLHSEHTIPVRLLGLGLPLTIVAGFVVALVLFPEFGVWHVAVLAAILAPTDAALGQVVVSFESVPVRIRQALNVESGLNDGIVVPAIMIFLWSAGANLEGDSGGFWARFVGMHLVLGPLVGFIVAWLGGTMVGTCRDRGWMSEEFQRLALIALALAAWTIAHYVSGNGFIAAFTAGLVLGAQHRSLVDKLHRFAEAEGQFLSLLVFMLFGAAMIPEALEHLHGFNPEVIGYALLSLTFIRILPVSLSLIGAGLRFRTHLFLGWFGPRGIATIIFALLVLEESGLPHAQPLFSIAIITVVLSILLHGLTAWPLSNRYAQLVQSDEMCKEEMVKTPEMPTRFGSSRR